MKDDERGATHALTGNEGAPGRRRRERSGGPAPIPSSEKLARHLRKRRLALGIVLCFVGAGLCLLALLVGQSFRVREIVTSGNVRYSGDALREASGIRIGDEVLSFGKDEVTSRLLENCPYLSEARVERTLSGKVTLSVVESRPEIALALPGDRWALTDGTLRVFEISDTEPDDLCRIYLSETGTVTVGAVPDFPATVGEEVREAIRAIGAAGLLSSAGTLSLTDRYAVTLTLRDGTVISLHSAKNLERKLCAAVSAYAGYRKPAEGGHVVIDVSEKNIVTVGTSPGEP